MAKNSPQNLEDALTFSAIPPSHEYEIGSMAARMNTATSA